MSLKDPAKIAAREAEKLERNKNKRPYNKREINPQTQTTMPEITSETVATNQPDAVVESNNADQPTPNVTPASSINEPIKVQNSAPSNYKAFSGKVIKRDYSTPKIDESLAGVVIPEANFGTPKVETANSAADDLKKINAQNPNQVPLHTQMQEATGFNALPAAEQNAATSLSADLILEGYDGLHGAARWFIKMPKEKLTAMEAENKINLGVVIMPATAEQAEVNLGGLFEQINDDVDNTIIVTEDFKNKVRAPLERLCAKYGLGTSDAVFVGAMFLKDAGTKAVMGYGLKKTLNQVLDVYSKQHMDINAEVQKRMQLEKERDEALLKSQTTKAKAKAEAEEKRAADLEAKEKNKKPSKSKLAEAEEKIG